MDRRSFLKSAAEAAAAASVTPAIEFGNVDFEMGRLANSTCTSEALNELFVKQNDKLIDTILVGQQTDKTKPFFGGFSGMYALFPVGKAAWYANRMACGLVSPTSKHFGAERVATAVANAMRFVKSLQHTDGTIDLTSTNFHSPPDTGFVVEPIALTLVIIRKHAPTRYLEFQKMAESFLKTAGQAMTIGGIHTPNHRWVVSMALARINNLIPDDKFVARIDQWLAEKIDIDAEGHYSERSTSIYSPLTNRCLITVARLLGRPELLDPVRKNLRLTPYLVHPNGEIVTEVSRRQDQFSISKMGRYYYPYRYLAIADGDKEFGSMARLIEQTIGMPNLYDHLTYLLEDEDFQKTFPVGGKLPVNYERVFARSKIVRIRRDESDATIIADNETFLTVHKGQAALRAVRFASAFFGKGQFKSGSVKQIGIKQVGIKQVGNNRTGGEYELEQSLQGPYYQPLQKKHLPNHGDWRLMPKHLRDQTQIQNLKSIVRIIENAGIVEVVFEVTGTDRVPIAIELAFGHEGQLDAVDPLLGIESVNGSSVAKLDDAELKDAFLLQQREFTYTVGNDKLKIETSSTSKHTWTQIRGALPKLDAQCVYVTDFTPFKFRLTIK